MSESAQSLEDRVLAFDDEFAGVMEKINDALPVAIKKTEFPATVKGTLGLIATADTIKLGMISLAEEENLYGSSILFRSLIEHYIRFHYLLFRFIEEQTDEPGKEYDRFSEISEILEMGESLKVAMALEGRPSDLDALGIMKQYDSSMADLTKKELNRITAKWKYRAILRYVVDRLRGDTSNKLPFLAKLVPIYGELSSFVHGGKSAERVAMRMINDGEAQDVVWDYAKWACILANSMKVFFLMILAKPNPELRPTFAELSACMRRFLAAKEDTSREEE